MSKQKYHQTYQKEQVANSQVDWVLIKRLFPYLKPYRWWFALAVFCLLLSRGCEVAAPIFLGSLAKAIFSSPPTEEVEQIVLKGIDITLLLLVVYFLDVFAALIKSWAGQKGIFTLRNEIFAHIQKLPLSFYDRYPIGRLMTRTVHDVDQINQMFTESIVPILGNIFLFIGIIIGLFIIDWKSALAVSLIFPFVYLLTSRFQRGQRIGYEKVRAVASGMNVFVQEHLMGASIVRNFGLQRSERKKFEEINDDYCSANLETIDQFAFFVAGIDFLQSLALTILFVALISLGTTFQAGTFFAFSLYALMIFRPLFDLADRYNILQSAMASSVRVFDILDKPIEQQNSKNILVNGIQSITFENVWFAYDDANWILKGISFEITKGESLALVGTTGAGKTTIMSLLLRFYEIQKGAIRINGIDIGDIPLPALRKLFSIVPQDPVIFSGSIYDNIALYDPGITKDKVKSIITNLDMNELINRYPSGIDHHLTERGGSLSTGERQLISLARAIAHNRDVLILDEATANIDTHTEKIIQEALKTVLQQQTSLVIAHRLSTVRDVSRILVLQAGLVAESGTHSELLSLKGIYEKLYRLQFAQY